MKTLKDIKKGDKVLVLSAFQHTWQGDEINTVEEVTVTDNTDKNTCYLDKLFFKRLVDEAGGDTEKARRKQEELMHTLDVYRIVLSADDVLAGERHTKLEFEEHSGRSFYLTMPGGRTVVSDVDEFVRLIGESKKYVNSLKADLQKSDNDAEE